MRWAEGRERILFQRLVNPALDAPAKKEVPTLEQFAPRFIEGHAKANRLKPSGIASKTAILRVYLIPAFGGRRLDAIKNEDVQRLKAQLVSKSPKTVNNVLTVLSVLLKKATRRLAAALAEHRHLRSRRVLCQDTGTPFTRQIVQNRMRLASKRSNVRMGVHILRHTFCLHLAMRGAPARSIQELVGHSDLTMTQRHLHLDPAAPQRATARETSAAK